MKALGSRLLLCAALVVAGPVAAEVFKWQDANGRIIYGDSPPSGVKAVPVTAPLTVVPADAPDAPAAPEAPTARQAPQASPAPTNGNAEQERQARRARMIQRCEAQRGVDCEREVDNLLDGPVHETYPDEYGYPVWVHTAPPQRPPVVRPPHRPTPKPRPPSRTPSKSGTGIAKDL